MIPERLNRIIPHLCGVPSLARRKRLLFMPRVFIDDTGSDPQAHIMNLAGWVAPVEVWEKFSDAWLEALHAPPYIGYFKHHEAKGNPPTGEFKGWATKECDQKILALAEVIADSDISYGALTGIRNDVMRRILGKALPPRRAAKQILRISGSFDLCFYNITALVLQYQIELKDKDIVDFVFDEGDSAFDACNKLWKQAKKEKLFSPAILEIAGHCTEGDDKKIMPLQAADLLAGQSTIRLRGSQTTEKPFQLLATKKRIIFNPIAGPEHMPFMQGLETMVAYLNSAWENYGPALLGKPVKE